jgi:hypothetical protein
MPPRPSPREFQPPERRPWSAIGPEFARVWGRPRGKVQPEHIAIYGPTGSGKSWWEATILVQRVRLRQSGVIVVATKPDDATLIDMGWPITDSWTGVRQNDQVIFWPRTNRLGTARKAYQAERIQDLLDRLWVPKSNNIVAFEDASYIEGLSGNLRDTMEMYLREGRSNGITVIRNKQRVQGGTRLMHSETDWKAAFAPSDEDDAERNAQLFGNKRDWTPVLTGLDREKREFVIQHKLTGVTYISWVDESPLDHPLQEDGRARAA